MNDIVEISRQAWNLVRLDSQPEFDSLTRDFALELEERALAVVETGTVDERDSHVARFEQAVKGIAELPNEAVAAVEVPVEPEQNTMAMAAPIPEDVKEELVEEVYEPVPDPPEPKKKPRKVQVRKPQVPRKPKVIKAAAAHASASKKAAPVAKKK